MSLLLSPSDPGQCSDSLLTTSAMFNNKTQYQSENNDDNDDDDDDDDDEFRALKHSALEEEQKSYEERLKDIIGTNQTQNHDNHHPRPEPTTGLDPNLPEAEGDHKEYDDDEQEEEFVYNGDDVNPFDSDIQSGDYSQTLEAILELNHNQQDQSSSSLSVNQRARQVSPTVSISLFDETPEDSLLNDHQSYPSLISPRSSSPVTASRRSSSSITHQLLNNSVSFTPSLSMAGSNTSSNFLLTVKRRPNSAQFSRLRSLKTPVDLSAQRLSSSVLASELHRLRNSSPHDGHQQPSNSDIYSPSPSVSNFIGHETPISKQTPSIAAESDPQGSGVFRWASLRRISQKIYPMPKRHPTTVSSPASAANTLLGLPTVIAASGVIVIGTGKGWVMVFDYGSNLKHVLGSDALVRDAGAVSALAISHDHTFIAVGHAMGHIYLYDLAKPKQPARSVPPTSLKLVQDDRAEGHLSGSRIIHLGFVGLRHTAIISADESGLAFYHALGQVLGLASTDVIRILGRYPDPISNNRAPIGHLRQFSELSVDTLATRTVRKPTRIFGSAPLPLGPSAHPTDHHSLVAILTSTKLIVIGLKPTPRTWWRCMRNVNDPDQSMGIGALSWFPSSSIKETKMKARVIKDPSNISVMDPLLAFSWGRMIRFVTVMSDEKDKVERDDVGEEGLLRNFNRKLNGQVSNLRFVEGKSWRCDSNVLAIQWLTWRIICVMTTTHLEVIDTQVWRRTGFEPIDIRGVVRTNLFKDLNLSSLASPSNSTRSTEVDTTGGGSVLGSFKAYKGKIFLLTTHDMRLGMVVSWADRILELVEAGRLTEAIDLTTTYWLGSENFETIGLPSKDEVRQELVLPKLREIMRASLEYVFSDQRMEDDTHFDYEGRGVDRTDLFEGFVRSCTRACLAIDELNFVFEVVFEQYQEHGIQIIFLEQIQPFIMRGELNYVPTTIIQALVEAHNNRKEFELIEELIRRVDPTCLDIDQVLGICSAEGLYDALVYIYTEAIKDFVGPLVEFLNMIKKIRTHRQEIQQSIEESSTVGIEFEGEEDVENLVPNAYKIFTYLSTLLCGLSYPNKIPYNEERASEARQSIYQFIFSGQSMHWPPPDGQLILMTEEGQQELTYPYLRALLMFDSEAMLDTLDKAFEDSWLHEKSDVETIDRQVIINLLLDVVSSGSQFSSTDRTFLYIFIARNLPKYSQFLSLPSSIVHSILVSLATENDQSTCEDRQLAVESLLSVYSPLDVENGTEDMIQLFEEAGFWSVLRSTFIGRKMWDRVIDYHLKDPECDGGVFEELSGILRKLKRSRDESMDGNVKKVISDSILQLVDISVPKTARVINEFLPQLHREAIEKLESLKFKQFAYVRSLLEPHQEKLHQTDMGGSSPVELGVTDRKRYVNLLCEFDPNHVLEYLQSTPDLVRQVPDLARVCKEHEIYEGYLWVLDQLGQTRLALQELDLIIKPKAVQIVRHLVSNQDKKNQSVESSGVDQAEELVAEIERLTNMMVEMCVSRSKVRQDGLTGEDCWFKLLSSVIGCIQTCATLLPNNDSQQYRHRSSSTSTGLFGQTNPIRCEADESVQVKRKMVESLRSILPTILSSLISRTDFSSQVSFSNLVRRLIESSQDQEVQRSIAGGENRSRQTTRSSTNEFRLIVMMIMDTYRFEGSVLEVTGRLIDQDLFKHVNDLKAAREKGIRPRQLVCEHCQLPVIGGDGGKLIEREEEEIIGGEDVKMKLMKRLGLPARPMTTAYRKKSLKGKEVEQSIESLTITNGYRTSQDLNNMNLISLDPFLNRNPIGCNNGIPPFLLSTPPRSISLPHPDLNEAMNFKSNNSNRTDLEGNENKDLEEKNEESLRLRKLNDEHLKKKKGSNDNNNNNNNKLNEEDINLDFNRLKKKNKSIGFMIKGDGKIYHEKCWRNIMV